MGKNIENPDLMCKSYEINIISEGVFDVFERADGIFWMDIS